MSHYPHQTVTNGLQMNVFEDLRVTFLADVNEKLSYYHFMLIEATEHELDDAGVIEEVGFNF